MATLDSNKVTGVSVVTNADDAATKGYIDTIAGEVIPSTIGNSGKFLSSYETADVLKYWTVRTSGTGNTPIGYSSGGNGLLYASGQTEPYVYSGSGGTLASSTNGIQWTLRTSGTSLDIRSITFGALPTATYVYAAGTDIATSTDAINWTLRTTGDITNSINALLYSTATSEYYVNVRNNGFIQTSTDAISWTLRTSGTSSSLSGIIYNNLYVTIITGGAITSTDTITWTLRTTGVLNAISALSYGNGIYIIGGAIGRVASSTDAIVWISRTTGFGSTGINTITYGNNYFFAGGNGQSRISTDAIFWSPIIPAVPNVYTSMYDGSNFWVGGSTVVTTVTMTSNATLASSSPLTIQSYWESINSPSSSVTFPTYKGSQEFTSSGVFYIPSTASTLYVEAIGAGGGGASGRYVGTLGSGGGGGGGSYTSFLIRRSEFVPSSTINVNIGAGGVSGNNRGMSTSSDGIIWSYVQKGSGFGTSILYTLMYDGTNYFAGGNGGVLTTSTNGEIWTYRTSGRTTQIGYNQGGNGLLYASGQTNPYVYAGASGVLASSTDSIRWTLRTSSSGTTQIQALAFGSLPTATYVRAISTAGNIATSTDAINWTLRTTGDTTNTINALLYSTATSEYYVNVGASGRLQTSTDAISWTLRTSGTTLNLNQIIYGDKYVAIGNNKVLITSTNAIEWTLRTSGVCDESLVSLFGRTNNMYTLSHTSGLYIFAGEVFVGSGSASNMISVSTDAIVWTLRTSNFGNTNAPAIYSSTFGNDIFVVGGVNSSSIAAMNTSTINRYAGNGGRGIKGGGGGGGGYNFGTNSSGAGGTGGDGYVRISWV